MRVKNLPQGVVRLPACPAPPLFQPMTPTKRQRRFIAHRIVPALAGVVLATFAHNALDGDRADGLLARVAPPAVAAKDAAANGAAVNGSERPIALPVVDQDRARDQAGAPELVLALVPRFNDVAAVKDDSRLLQRVATVAAGPDKVRP